MKKDRFAKLATNYGELIVEVFASQGIPYNRLEEIIFEKVAELEPAFADTPILDIGIGDGKTSAAFVKAGCQHLTGIDLNPHMLASAKENLGSGINLLQLDATRMTESFAPEQFPIMIAAHAIHNIARESRNLFWKQIRQLAPRLIVLSEKITDPDEAKHQACYERELAALSAIYGEKYHLEETLREWIAHYEYDDANRLYVSEIIENLGNNYDICITWEVGLYKTVIATLRK